MQKNQIISLKKQRYRLLNALATGAQGTVWKVEVEGDDGKHYALKVVNLYDSFNFTPPQRHIPRSMDILIKYAKAEIVFLNALHSSEAHHIAPCLDDGAVQEEDYALPAFIMPLYQLENLEARIKRTRDSGKLIDKNLWLRWFKQLMGALRHIQSNAAQGKLAAHRDLKPANCLFDQDDNLFLADFGLVRESNNTGISSVSNVGTFNFCAPEQRFAHSIDSKGKPHFYITDRLDVYSAAMVMHEVIIGSTDAQQSLDTAVIEEHQYFVSRLDKAAKGKVGKLGKLGGLTAKEFNNLKQTLNELFNPVENRGKTIAFAQVPSLPNYPQITQTTALLIKDMLAAWPDERPDVNRVLSTLDDIKTTLNPELYQLALNANQFDVFIGQALSIEFIIDGKGLIELQHWLQISLDHVPLEKPLIEPIDSKSYKLKLGLQHELPIFTELKQHQLRFSATINGKEHSAEASINIKPDANYHWTMGQRLDALKLELRDEWLDQWEDEANKANSIFAKSKLLEALQQLQHQHPDNKTALQQRFERNDQIVMVSDGDGSATIKRVIGLVAVIIATTLAIGWLTQTNPVDQVSDNGTQQQTDDKKTPLILPTEDSDKATTAIVNEINTTKKPFEPDMLPIPSGSFTMGCLDSRDNVEGGCVDDEKPAHKVTLKAFELAKTEVTFDQWDACVKAKGCQYKPDDENWGRGQRPVINVSWNDTQHYIKWLNKETSKHYRLPSEAEWEYSARGGETEQAYPWGDKASHNQANYDGKDGKDQWDYTAPVASFPANDYGLHDMHGNVWEWVQDKRHKNYKKAPNDGSAWLSGNSAYRVLRGGTWINTPWFLRSAFRNRSTPGRRDNSIGFRLARSLAK